MEQMVFKRDLSDLFHTIKTKNVQYLGERCSALKEIVIENSQTISILRNPNRFSKKKKNTSSMCS